MSATTQEENESEDEVEAIMKLRSAITVPMGDSVSSGKKPPCGYEGDSETRCEQEESCQAHRQSVGKP